MVSRPRLIRRAVEAAAVLAAVLAFGVGLPALNRAIPAARALPADRPFLVGGGVTVVPPAGAQYDVTKTTQRAGQGAVLFVVGNIRYTVVVLSSDRTLAEAVAALRTKITGRGGYQLVGKQSTTRTSQGVPGVQGGYATSGRAGRYAVYVFGGRAVEVTFAGTELEIHDTLPALSASVNSLTFPAAG